MSNVVDLDAVRDGLMWRDGWAVCATCGHRQMSVWPEDPAKPLRVLECGACGLMTSAPVGEQG